MSVPTFNPRTAILALFIVAVALLRLLSFYDLGPLTYFTPIGAMTLFGGAYFSGYLKPLAFPLLTMFIGDAILSFTMFQDFRTGLLYSGWYWTYLAFALMVIAGKLIIRTVNVKNVVFATFAATSIHWLVSDIGACSYVQNYSFSVYLERLATALPYEGKFLGGTAFFNVIMFGGFELMQRRYSFLKVSDPSAQ